MNKLIAAAGFLSLIGSLSGGTALAEEGSRARPPVYWNGDRDCPAGMYCRDADDRPIRDRDDRRRLDRDDRRFDRDDRRFDRDDRRFDRDDRSVRDRDER